MRPQSSGTVNQRKSAAHTFELFVIGEAGADLSVALEKVSKDRVGVHGDVAEDVVKDVGFGGVLHGVARSRAGAVVREHAIGEHISKKFASGREEAARDGRGLPAGAGLEEVR